MMCAALSSLLHSSSRPHRKATYRITARSSGPCSAKSLDDSISGTPPSALAARCTTRKLPAAQQQQQPSSGSKGEVGVITGGSTARLSAVQLVLRAWAANGSHGCGADTVSGKYTHSVACIWQQTATAISSKPCLTRNPPVVLSRRVLCSSKAGRIKLSIPAGAAAPAVPGVPAIGQRHTVCH